MLCRFDDLAVFNYPFTRGQVTQRDYSHPSLSGQATLASNHVVEIVVGPVAAPI